VRPKIVVRVAGALWKAGWRGVEKKSDPSKRSSSRPLISINKTRVPFWGQNIGVKNPHKPVHTIENMAESGVREQETGATELESPERQDHRCGKMRDGEE
jgi:hypothetical protein